MALLFSFLSYFSWLCSVPLPEIEALFNLLSQELRISSNVFVWNPWTQFTVCFISANCSTYVSDTQNVHLNRFHHTQRSNHRREQLLHHEYPMPTECPPSKKKNQHLDTIAAQSWGISSRPKPKASLSMPADGKMHVNPIPCAFFLYNGWMLMRNAGPT